MLNHRPRLTRPATVLADENAEVFNNARMIWMLPDAGITVQIARPSCCPDKATLERWHQMFVRTCLAREVRPKGPVAPTPGTGSTTRALDEDGWTFPPSAASLGDPEPDSSDRNRRSEPVRSGFVRIGRRDGNAQGHRGTRGAAPSTSRGPARPELVTRGCHARPSGQYPSVRAMATPSSPANTVTIPAPYVRPTCR